VLRILELQLQLHIRPAKFSLNNVKGIQISMHLLITTGHYRTDSVLSLTFMVTLHYGVVYIYIYMAPSIGHGFKNTTKMYMHKNLKCKVIIPK